MDPYVVFEVYCNYMILTLKDYDEHHLLLKDLVDNVRYEG